MTYLAETEEPPSYKIVVKNFGCNRRLQIGWHKTYVLLQSLLLDASLTFFEFTSLMRGNSRVLHVADVGAAVSHAFSSEDAEGILQKIWGEIADSPKTEWKSQNIVAGLILTGTLTLLQVDAFGTDVVTCAPSMAAFSTALIVLGAIGAMLVLVAVNARSHSVEDAVFEIKHVVQEQVTMSRVREERLQPGPKMAWRNQGHTRQLKAIILNLRNQLRCLTHGLLSELLFDMVY
ncbi:hypothetical protein FISHEDRAFT_60382 [Fistulina hepatica ATCC 64428]|uniref:Uncharacterized protein n=1 Tax=Fistulina hepatica ATCC 64428 TaxID=1128425 RepID=A0A0D7A6I0_9AGAR|nr:hypothetical protein FISHEDRAFT_60382 [Fistulina hepatica ATCC 64428]